MALKSSNRTCTKHRSTENQNLPLRQNFFQITFFEDFLNCKSILEQSTQRKLGVQRTSKSQDGIHTLSEAILTKELQLSLLKLHSFFAIRNLRRIALNSPAFIFIIISLIFKGKIDSYLKCSYFQDSQHGSFKNNERCGTTHKSHSDSSCCVHSENKLPIYSCTNKLSFVEADIYLYYKSNRNVNISAPDLHF